MPIFFILQTAFSLYMLVHASRRGAPQYWWFIIMLPFGEWAYFFAVYLPSRKPGASKALPFTRFFDRPTSLEELRRAHRHTPSHDNLLRLAQGLYDAGRFAEANERFSEILSDYQDDNDALFGYAQTCLSLDDNDAAITAFEHLLDHRLDFRDHGVAFELARVYWKADREKDCIALLERVCKSSQRLEPRVQLARYLVALERLEEARQTLDIGLDSLAGSPPHARRNQRIFEWQAKRMLRELADS